jgi:FkbM family methyltransferase
LVHPVKISGPGQAVIGHPRATIRRSPPDGVTLGSVISVTWDAVRGLGVYGRARIGRGISAQGFYAQRLRFRDLVFDVGANVGQHTAMMVKRGARVVALEPQAELARELVRRFPTVEVVPLGVSDRPGKGVLMVAGENDHLTTLNPAWTTVEQRFPWSEGKSVRLTTLDELIARFGMPAFVKIDTEGFEDRVLAGLSRPVEQCLFEVHAGLPDVAAGAFDRLADLGRYEYRMMEKESWCFGARTSREAILANLPDWGDVYARRVH